MPFFHVSAQLVIFVPPPAEGMSGHIAFRSDVTSVCASVTFVIIHNFGTFYARKLKFYMLLTHRPSL